MCTVAFVSVCAHTQRHMHRHKIIDRHIHTDTDSAQYVLQLRHCLELDSEQLVLVLRVRRVLLFLLEIEFFWSLKLAFGEYLIL